MLLPQSFYNRPTLKVAQELLGCFLCRVPKAGEVVRCKIIETEAYVGFKDKASHASRGKTMRNAPMFGPPGYTYVYFTYGMHYMLNIVTERENYPAAVLIRAVELTSPRPSPYKGEGDITSTEMVPLSLPRRGVRGEVTNGPAKLTKFLQIDKSLNNIPIFTKKYGLWIEPSAPVPPSQIIHAPRVGVDYAEDYKNKLWRFYIRDNKFVSKK